MVERFRAARRDRTLAVLEGLHPLKHAIRFGADVLEVVTDRPGRLERLAELLAPDVAGTVTALATPIDAELFRRLAPRPPPTGALAIAHRREATAADVLASDSAAPVVLLERTARHENLGAAIRVAAAAGAAGVLAVGPRDPWHPAAIRGAAGLQFALPVARADRLPETDRPLVAVAPGAATLPGAAIPPRAILAFGSERDGLSPAVLERADLRLGIPMRAGVSSLNLATSVAVVLYGARKVR